MIIGNHLKKKLLHIYGAIYVCRYLLVGVGGWGSNMYFAIFSDKYMEIIYSILKHCKKWILSILCNIPSYCQTGGKTVFLHDYSPVKK